MTILRIPTLDFIRGLAILGILLLNINAFGLPGAAWFNPAWQGEAAPHNALAWAMVDLFAQLKCLALLALLFGGGLQLQLPRGRWIQTRLSWLVLFGALHSLLLWEGDILLDYGLIGLVAWPMIRDVSSTRQLFNTGVLLYVIGCGVFLVLGMSSGPHPGSSWLPGIADVQYETFWRTHGGWEAMHNRLDLFSSSLISLAVQYGWQLAGLMLIGATLMRSGWLQGSWSLTHYRHAAAWLLVPAVLFQLPGICLQWAIGWDFRWASFFLQLPLELGAPMQAVGYAALCFGFWPTLARLKMTHAVSCVGRMALSNYLLQTLICTTFFNRLGWFNQFDRLQLLALVPAVWLVNILFSLLWLRYFRQGPVEWLWRRLTALGSDWQQRNPARRG